MPGYIKILSAFILCLALTGCEKVVNINLGTAAPQVVVQGAIETGLPPYVVLTSTISYSSQVNLTTLQNSFLHGATITVSDGSSTITLREYSFDTGVNNKFYIYSVDTANLTNPMLGQVGKFYTLNVTYNGTTYTSVTKIPAPKGIDSMWFGQPTSQSSKIPANAQQLFVNYTDPDTPGNYVRYFTQIDGGIYYPSGVFSDQAVNGKTIDDIGLYAGYDNSIDANGDSLSYFYPGETVTLKWCEIDKNVYNFWNTYQYANASLGNPFASPINIQTNISNGALGIWAGYGSVLTTAVVPF